ncbi:hypothetical protein GQ53DRAFT_742876 [Thozetella sp. PMI_491]|nr:hypothetical protein GQ53DRAFT_742876 [Thozetella sp. PMI_491]
MDDLDAKTTSPWLGHLGIIPPEYNYIVRMISWFFITLALAPIIPLLVLILYDLLLWIWRLCMTRPEPSRAPGLRPHQN